MLRTGDVLFLVWPEGEERIGEVTRLDGAEGCVIRAANGTERRWNVRSDERHVFDNARVERAVQHKSKEP